MSKDLRWAIELREDEVQAKKLKRMGVSTQWDFIKYILLWMDDFWKDFLSVDWDSKFKLRIEFVFNIQIRFGLWSKFILRNGLCIKSWNKFFNSQFI